jgi:splicing factor 3B subunit 2
MGLSAAEKNKRKRERKKKEKEERRKYEIEEKKANDDAAAKAADEDEIEIEIEYVSPDLPTMVDAAVTTKSKDDEFSSSSSALPDGLPPQMTQGDDSSKKEEEEQQQQQKEKDNSIDEVLRRFHERAAVGPSESDRHDDNNNNNNDDKNEDQSSIVSDDDSYDDDDDQPTMSKRKLREMIRPTVADLKRRVQRPDLVEAHDVTAADPDFLIALKAIPHTTPVPFHWGRKRKYLQGKRGLEKTLFKLPDFIIKTGITNIRDTAMEEEEKQNAKQTNRGRVNPKMGSMDVDYKILYEAFFKYQTKPKNLTSWGDLYYEGKESETNTDIKPGGTLSKSLQIALGMGGSKNAPPPWLWNMQRYGPPPNHQRLKIPGLNAPLPNSNCQYGYHPGGWGKPPVDAYGRPLYGGNPLGRPGSGGDGDDENDGRELVTSDGKTVLKASWGGLPVGGDYPGQDGGGDDMDNDNDDSSSSEEESESDDDDEDMDMESDAEDEEGTTDGTESVLPPPAGGIEDLRKQPAGDETPAPPPKRLYQVLETGAASEQGGGQSGIFQSDVRYVVPGAATAAGTAAPVPEGAESVLSKAVAPVGDESGSSRKKRKHNNADDDEEEFDKNFKF